MVSRSSTISLKVMFDTGVTRYCGKYAAAQPIEDRAHAQVILPLYVFCQTPRNRLLEFQGAPIFSLNVEPGQRSDYWP
jgi:hypothetical protein